MSFNVDARGANITQVHGAQYTYVHNPENGNRSHFSVSEVMGLISSQQPSKPSDVKVSPMPSTILAIVPALHVTPIPALIFSTRSSSGGATPTVIRYVGSMAL